MLFETIRRERRNAIFKTKEMKHNEKETNHMK